MTRLCLPRATLLLTVLLLATAPSTSAAPGAKTDLPADLDLIPRDAVGFATFRPARFLQTPLATTYGKLLTENHPETLELLAVQLGVPVAEIDRVSVAVLEPDPSRGLLIVTTTKPYRQADVLAKTTPRAREQKYRGKTYHWNGTPLSPAVLFVSDRIFLVAPPAVVRYLLDRAATPKREGPLSEALKLAAGEHHGVVGWSLPASSLGILRAFLPREIEAMVPLLDARFGTVTLDVERDVKFDLQMAFPSEASAKGGSKAAQAGIALGRDLLALAQKEVAKDAPSARVLTPLVGLADSTLKEMNVRQEGAMLRSLVRVEADPTMVLAGLFLDPVRRFWEGDKRGPHLRQIAAALSAYHTAHGKLPPAVIRDRSGKALYSWRVAILPQLGETALHRQFKLDEPWDSPQNKKLLDRMPAVFAPGDNSGNQTVTFFQVFTGKGTAFESPLGHAFKDFTDGTGKTLLVVEGGEAVPWTKPADLEYDPSGPLPKLGGNSKKEFSSVFADGNFRVLSLDTDEKTLRAFITRNGGEVIREP